MMLRTSLLFLAGFGVLLAALSVRAQQAPPDAGGVWVGYLGSGPGLELHLTQEGQGLSGSGLLQQAGSNNPIYLNMGGELNSQGSALLQLQGSSIDNKDA